MNILDHNEYISDELRTVIQNTNDLMFVKNRDYVYVAASDNFARHCVRCNGVDDILGKTDFELFVDKSIAQRYREDDEKLFASGKHLIEFEEIYPDKDGRKHVCMTTKYLLYDRDGKPAGIFGQYHDIGTQLENEISRRRDINKYVAEALNRPFFASNYVDLRTHRYEVLRSMNYSLSMLDNCETMEQAFDSFINTLVKPEFQEKMHEFCNTATIAERLEGKRRIDCDYLSKVAIGWCRASMYPCEWDENGKLTHILFAVSGIDENVANEIEENIAGRKTLQAVFDNVPGGIVMYDWDGKTLKVINISRYYKERYGYSMINDKEIPDYMRIHQEDLEDYQRAIYHALTVTHSLEYVFRVWDKNKEEYCWTKINAVSREQPNGHSYVYAMYSDVSEQKIAEMRLKKSNASIMAALGASEQLNYEYDPVAHTSTCFTEDNDGYDLDRVITNYPECFRETDFMHPDDVELFIRTVREIDNGADFAHCEIRVNKDGQRHWHSCTFEAFYDSEKEHRVAFLTVIDITPKVMAIKNYEKKIKTLSRNNKNAICICDVNLTKNRFSNTQSGEYIRKICEKSKTLDELMMYSSNAIEDCEERKKYLELFNCRKMLELFEKGNNHISMEHFYKISDTHTEWVETIFDLISDPVSGDVVGIGLAKSRNITKFSRVLLDAALEKDYPMAAIVYYETGEYYLYEAENNAYCEHKLNYWENVRARVKSVVAKQDIDEVVRNLDKEKVISQLEDNKEYEYAFYGTYQGKVNRLEAKFRYVDKTHGLIIATLRNINDIALYRKYKHDSEHDQLTGLLNRISLFKACRKLLNEHPGEQFIMLHGDMKHFHLYNTFFGEDAGNKLLCLVADCLREIDQEYEYWAYGRIEADVFCTFFPLNPELLEKHTRKFTDMITNFRSDFFIEISMGVYKVTDTSMPIEAMFNRATVAAKSDKKNLYDIISVYDDAMEQDLLDKQQVIQDMQKAIDREEFKVYLQPKYSLRTEKMVGSEALVRWIHPEKGMVSPGKFIPVFEGNGFITTLDRYMWEHVCQILRRWQDEGRPMYPISVNVSRISMYIQSTVPYLKDLVTRYGIDPKYLELELTESAYMDDPEDLKRMLRELKEFGFTILMDDFGSGYSSLNTLRELPVDILKLDMKFLSKSQNDSRGAAVLSSVVRMSKLLGLPIVAEGVEKKEQANYLCDIGCEYAQGFLFARPMPVDEYEQLLRPREEPEKSPMTISKDHIVQLLVDQESVTTFIGDVFPSAVAFIEYENNRFRVLRANKKFLHQFEIFDDVRRASDAIIQTLDSHSYSIFMEAIQECIKSKTSVTFSITWPGKNGDENLIGCVDYEGAIDQIENLMLAFMNMTGMKK